MFEVLVLAIDLNVSFGSKPEPVAAVMGSSLELSATLWGVTDAVCLRK